MQVLTCVCVCLCVCVFVCVCFSVSVCMCVRACKWAETHEALMYKFKGMPQDKQTRESTNQCPFSYFDGIPTNPFPTMPLPSPHVSPLWKGLAH